MTRITVLLAGLLVVCSLALITSQHRARKLFTDLDRANNQTQQLEVRWEQLLVDQTALGSATLIDAKARRSLSMQHATQQRTLHLTVEGAAERPEVEHAVARGGGR